MWGAIVSRLIYVIVGSGLTLIGSWLYHRFRPHKPSEMDLQLQIDDLKDNFEAYSLLTVGVGHDLKNMIQILVSSLEILSLEFPESDEVVKGLDKVLVQIGNLVDVLGEPSDEIKNNHPLDVKDFIEREYRLLELLANSEVEIRLDLNSVKMKVNYVDLTQILINLVKNAADATLGQIGPKITISTYISTASDLSELINIPNLIDDYCMIRIEDNGHGIGESSISDLFHPYYTTKSNGKGIGLSIVQRLTIKNNGIILVDESIERGFAISIGFPIHD